MDTHTGEYLPQHLNVDIEIRLKCIELALKSGLIHDDKILKLAEDIYSFVTKK
jgi:hypothetical protein